MEIVDFIKSKRNNTRIDLAVRQQEQIAYFTQSSIQKEINEDYIEKWAEAKYLTNDYFLNWVKAIFRTENFLSFFLYFRHPICTAKLINNKIKPQLSRVFHAEDSFFKYELRGEQTNNIPELESESFQEEIFNALIFNHNDILVHDLKDANKPYRKLVPIDKVVAIDSYKGVIKKLAYTARIVYEGEQYDGFLYLDDEKYVFFDADFEEIFSEPHDLGECPADYIAKEAFAKEDVVRKSIFSYSLESLEEYVFLKTLQRMQDPNGALPVTVELKAKVSNLAGLDKKSPEALPMSASEISGQRSKEGGQVVGASKNSPQQAGSRIVVEAPKRDGKYDMEAVKNYINHFYIPVEALTYLNERIQQVEKEILVSVLGDYSEASESAKNELQVAKSYDNRQDKLRFFSLEMSRVRNISDSKMLRLKHGPDSAIVDCFYGSDFFMESQKELFAQFKDCPNTIERKNILIKIAQTRHKFNKNRAHRDKILYNLIPYSSDIDFDKAVERQIVDDITFQYQTRFDYYVGLFESAYGGLVYVYELIEGTESEIYKVINELIVKIIKEDYEHYKAYRTPESVQAGATGVGTD